MGAHLLSFFFLSSSPTSLLKSAMVVASKPATIDSFSSYTRPTTTSATLFSEIPLIDLSKPESKHLLVKACEELGFFKVVNHGVPMEFITKLESQARAFFSLPPSEKSIALGYGSKSIGPNGDVGWLEYLLLRTKPDSGSLDLISGFGQNPHEMRCVVDDYVRSVRKMACEVLEMMADGLKVQPRNVLSKLLMDEESDSVFRLNHYPPCPEREELQQQSMIGFGEHTDPQIISVLRSNNTSGLQISLTDGTWISVPPDETSFFINVGDSLQVMTNGRFPSVRHRVMANTNKSRLSMIYFGGPPLSEKIAPIPSLVKGGESLYKEFTWFEYKKSAFRTRLSDNRLGLFERIAAS